MTAVNAQPQVPPAAAVKIRGETCRRCKFSDQKGAGLFCVRNPPTVVIVPDQAGRPTTGSAWPPVNPQQWCGEFKLRIEGVS